NDFGITERIHLRENRRCPQDVFALARRLVMINTPIFADREVPQAERVPAFPVRAVEFSTDEAEAAWILDDIRRDREADKHGWGSVAVLYRKHEIGNHLETAFLAGGIPCRLAQGRALADDPVVAYVMAAARVIANPADDIFAAAFFRAVLPRALYEEALTRSE